MLLGGSTYVGAVAHNSTHKALEWTLRIAVAAEFFGHGCYAVMQKSDWIQFVTLFGFSVESARTVMLVVGALDLGLAALVLIRPIRLALLWMSFWGFFTAALRPASGLSIIDFIERGANWGAPLALLLLFGWPKSWRELLELHPKKRVG